MVQIHRSPYPDTFYSTADTYAQTLELDNETALVDRSRRTLERWVDRAAEGRQKRREQ